MISSRSRSVDLALGCYPRAWRLRRGEEVRTVVDDLLAEGKPAATVALSLMIGGAAARLRSLSLRSIAGSARHTSSFAWFQCNLAGLSPGRGALAAVALAVVSLALPARSNVIAISLGGVLGGPVSSGNRTFTGSTALVKIAATLLLAVVLAALVMVYQLLARRRSRHRPLGSIAGLVVKPEVAELNLLRVALADVADLLGNVEDPRRAVLASWSSLEAMLARMGEGKDQSETSLELAQRILSEHDVDARALATLHDLFWRARFSSGPLDEIDRDLARRAIGSLRRDIEEREPLAERARRLLAA